MANFGWLSPVAGHAGSNFEPIVMYQEESDTDSEQWLERLTHLRELGVTHFVMDFGHPLHVDPALRFAEQVIAPIKAS